MATRSLPRRAVSIRDWSWRIAAFDFAIIDMNLNGVMSFAIADAISARHIPFIFASGYDATRTGDRYQQILVL